MRQPDDGVVNCAVTMGVVLTHDVTDDTGGLFVGSSGSIAAFPHAVEHPAMNWFETVSNIGKCTADDDAHGVVEVTALELFLDINRFDAVRRRYAIFSHGLSI